jgi:hypothetical protein
MSSQAAVADDQLRPAFAQLARATGDVEKSTELMSLALDVSAGTGKSLDTVVRALSRAVGPEGTTGALERLAPAIKGASDPLAELQRQFEGSAEKAAQLDPYQRFQVAIGEVSESVGYALLPALGSLADWFIQVQPDIQSFLDKLVGALKNPTVDASIKRMQDSLGNLGFTIGTLFGSTETDQAKGFQNFWVALAGAIELVSNLLAGLLAPLSAAFGNTKPMENWLDTLLGGVMNVVAAASGARGNATGGAPMTEAERRAALQADKRNVTININKGNVTAKEIANAVNKGTKVGGAPALDAATIRRIGAR